MGECLVRYPFSKGEEHPFRRLLGGGFDRRLMYGCEVLDDAGVGELVCYIRRENDGEETSVVKQAVGGINEQVEWKRGGVARLCALLVRAF